MVESVPLTSVDTLPKLLLRNFRQFGAKHVAMREKDLGIWRSYTWADYYRVVKRLGLALNHLGLKRGDRIAILAENKPHAYWFELAGLALGAIVEGVFADCTPPEVEYYLGFPEVKFAICQDQEQVDKVLAVRERLPKLEGIFYWETEGMWSYHDPILAAFENLLELGAGLEEGSGDHFEACILNTSAQDTAFFFFSSGTTGNPKVIMITHHALIGIAVSYNQIDAYREDEEYVSFLPLAWIPEQLWGVTGSLYFRYRVNFPEDAETVQSDIREIGPQVLFFGPRLWEGILRDIQARMLESSWLHQWVYRAAMSIGLRAAESRMAGRPLRPLMALAYRAADAAVFRWLRDHMGLSKVRVAYTGGSSVSPDILRYYHAIGVPLKQTYGSSEVGLVTCHRDGDIRPETVGPPLPNLEVRVTEEGEIVVRSQFMFSGYYKEPAKTADKLRDGWYHTGDFGHFDERGHLIVMDRMEDVMRLPGGKRFSPQFCEVRLRFSPYIKDVLMVAREDHPLIAAMINIDLANVGKWAESHHIAYTTFADLSQKPEVIELVRKEIERINSILPDYSRIRKFVNLHKEFDPDDAEMTRTRKIRRTYVEKRYADIIGAIYSDDLSVKVQSEVVYRDGRRGSAESEIGIVAL